MSDVKTHYRLPVVVQDEPGALKPSRVERWERWFYQPYPPEKGQRIVVFPDYDVAIDDVMIELDDDDAEHDFRYVVQLSQLIAGVAGGAETVAAYLAAHDWENLDAKPILTNDDRAILGMSMDHMHVEIDEAQEWFDAQEQEHRGHKLYASAEPGSGVVKVGAVTDSVPLIRLTWDNFGVDDAREFGRDLIEHADVAAGSKNVQVSWAPQVLDDAMAKICQIIDWFNTAEQPGRVIPESVQPALRRMEAEAIYDVLRQVAKVEPIPDLSEPI